MEGIRPITPEPAPPPSLDLSIVIPIKNEEDNVTPLLDELRDVLSSIGKSFEIIVINDGSTDRTLQLLTQMRSGLPQLRIVTLKRSFGQSAAMAAGIDHSRGDVIITMDGDLQNDPADIPKLLTALEDADCVSGWRKNRKDPLFTKKIPSLFSNRLARLTGVQVHDSGCTLKAYRRSAIADVQIYGEGHRYIPAKLHSRGYRVSEIVVNHRARTRGRSKYKAGRIVRGFLDLLFHIFWNRYSTRPLHVVGGLGLVLMFLSTLIGLVYLVLKFATGIFLTHHLPELLFALGLFFFGVQLMMLGVLAEILMRFYYKDNRPYNVERLIE